jgi:hypothetical protein
MILEDEMGQPADPAPRSKIPPWSLRRPHPTGWILAHLWPPAQLTLESVKPANMRVQRTHSPDCHYCESLTRHSLGAPNEGIATARQSA